MKISKLFHYLYASILLLPLVVIPAFMIYSHRHDVAQDFEVVEEVPVYYETNEVNSIDDLIDGHAYTFTKNTNYNIVMTLYDVKGYDNWTESAVSQNYPTPFFLCYGSDNYLKITIGQDAYYKSGQFSIDIVYRDTNENNLSNLDINDINPCTNWLKEYQEVTTTIPKDVMTSFMDRFNNTIDTYFNMKRVFNLNDLYNWFNVNFFNSASPISFNILFNLFTYWLFVSLLWLLFDAFMYIPLIMHNAIDKARIE